MQLTAPMPACIKPKEAWQYVSGPHQIRSGTDQVFDFQTRGPLGMVQLRLLCIRPNNGYKTGREVPIEMVYRNAVGDRDGAPRWIWQVEGTVVRVFFAATAIEILDTTGAPGTFTPSEWRLKIYAVA